MSWQSAALILSVFVLLTGCGNGASDSESLPAVADSAKATAAQFWAKYDSNLAFAGLVKGNLVYSDSIWGPGQYGGLDTTYRVDQSVLKHSATFTYGVMRPSSIDFAPYEIAAVERWPGAKTSLDGQLTVVCARDDANDKSIVSFVWSTQDGLKTLDPSSRQDIEVRRRAWFTGLAIDTEQKRIYVADVKNFEVLVVEDTNQDGVPDSVSSTSAVSYPMYCGDITSGHVPIGLRFLRGGGQEGLLPRYTIGPNRVHIGDEAHRGSVFWKDNDSDGTMDSVAAWTPVSKDIFMFSRSTLFPGATTLKVDSPINQLREIRSIATSPSELLASFTLTERPYTAALSRPLAAGETIALTCLGGTPVMFDMTVPVAPKPRANSVSPDNCILSGGPTTHTVAGLHFNPDAIVQLCSGLTVKATATVTGHQPNSLTITMPNLTDPTLAESRGLTIRVTNPGSDYGSTVLFYVQAP